MSMRTVGRLPPAILSTADARRILHETQPQNRARRAACPIRQYCGTQRPPCAPSRARVLPSPAFPNKTRQSALGFTAETPPLSLVLSVSSLARVLYLPSPEASRVSLSLPRYLRSPDRREVRPDVVGEAHPGLLAARGLGLRGRVNVLMRPDLSLERVEHRARHDGRRAVARRRAGVVREPRDERGQVAHVADDDVGAAAVVGALAREERRRVRRLVLARDVRRADVADDESSTATQRAGGARACAAALRYTSGAGLKRGGTKSDSPECTASRPKSARSPAASTHACTRGADDVVAMRTGTSAGSAARQLGTPSHARAATARCSTVSAFCCSSRLAYLAAAAASAHSPSRARAAS